MPLKMNGTPHETDHEAENGEVRVLDGNQVSFWCSTRLALAVVGFFGSLHLYAFRINLSVAMVCMVNQTAVSELSQQKQLDVTNYTGIATTEMPIDVNVTEPSCGGSSLATNGTSSKEDGEFVWDRSTQGIILGAFFWGYLATQIPGGILAAKFGAKRTLGIFMLVSSIATGLTPFAARAHYGVLILLRVIVGFGSGMWFPGFHAFWSHWAPPMERSKLLGVTYAGTQLGNIITLPLAGLLCKYGLDGGWPCIFYLLGATGFIWVCVWMFMASDMPDEQRFISEKEKRYIHESLRGQGAEEETVNLRSVPLKKIFTCLPFWSILVMNVTNDWGAYTFLTGIPSYMSDVFKFDITTTGFYAALPYIGFWLVCCLVGFPADWARSNGYLTTTTVRKVCNALGNSVPALLIIIIGFLDCSQSSLAVGLLTIGVSFVGFVFCGYVINHVDIAPKYSGILFGITNTAAAATGFVAPYINGVLTEHRTRESWQIVFAICAGVFLFGAVFNLIFGSGEIQDWAVDPPQRVEDGMVEIPLNDKPTEANGDVRA